VRIFFPFPFSLLSFLLLALFVPKVEVWSDEWMNETGACSQILYQKPPPKRRKAIKIELIISRVRQNVLEVPPIYPFTRVMAACHGGDRREERKKVKEKGCSWPGLPPDLGWQSQQSVLEQQRNDDILHRHACCCLLPAASVYHGAFLLPPDSFVLGRT